MLNAKLFRKDQIKKTLCSLKNFLNFLYPLVLTGKVTLCGWHTFTMSYARAKSIPYFISSDSVPYATIEMFDKIADATLFIFLKFTTLLEHHESLAHQVSFSLVNTTRAFSNLVKLRKFMSKSKKNICTTDTSLKNLTHVLKSYNYDKQT